MRKLILISAAAAMLAACATRHQPAEIALIPQPTQIVQGDGSVEVNPGNIITAVDTTIKNPEGYTLTAKEGKVEIRGGSDAGVFYGLQTLEQLKDSAGYVPVVEITDAPRFPWRGMHFDVSRHFQPKDYVKRYLDIMAYHKLNRFHWHLTDGIGWRLQIDKYPLLTQKAAWRKIKDEKAPWIGFELSEEGADSTYGGYYTKEDVREIVEYAKSKYITVIPEIEMPGHSEAATFAYPEYNCEGAAPGSGIYCPGKEETFTYLEGIIDEVIEMFPESPYIHIGGDEVGKGQWAACPLCQKRKKAEGLKDEHELQSYFVHRMEEYINSKGKGMVGWDEIQEGGLAPNATVMSWTGYESGIKAANAGHDVVMAPLDYVYFDHYQGQNPCEPQGWGGFNGIKRVYSFDPVQPGIVPDKVHHIQGGQANLWAENIRTQQHIEYMLLPRMSALSEALWTDTTAKDWNRFEKKLDRQLDRYAARGWNYAESAFTPFVAAQQFNADGSLTIQLETELDGYPVHYTLDGTAPTLQSSLYTDPIVVKGPATLQAVAFRNGKAAGCLLIVPNLLNKATQATVTYATPFSPAYQGGGDTALVDNRYAFKRGDDKAWQGFEKADMDVTLDLGKIQTIEGVALRFLQHIASTSVLLPDQVTVWTSADGKTFAEAANLSVLPDRDSEVLIRPLDVRFKTPLDVRYIRIRAKNRGILPEWHPRAGGSAWVFTDEITVY